MKPWVKNTLQNLAVIIGGALILAALIFAIYHLN